MYLRRGCCRCTQAKSRLQLEEGRRSELLSSAVSPSIHDTQTARWRSPSNGLCRRCSAILKVGREEEG